MVHPTSADSPLAIDADISESSLEAIPLDDLVIVERCDRQAAAIVGSNGIDTKHWLSGEADWHPLVRAFARHRIFAIRAAALDGETM